jgi:hypothetical protein
MGVLIEGWLKAIPFQFIPDKPADFNHAKNALQ